MPFIGQGKSEDAGNNRYESYVDMAEMLYRSWLKILPDIALQEELLTIRYKFGNDGKTKQIISKDEMMRKYHCKSPNKADALSMAVWGIKRAAEYSIENKIKQSYAIMDMDPFANGREQTYGRMD